MTSGSCSARWVALRVASQLARVSRSACVALRARAWRRRGLLQRGLGVLPGLLRVLNLAAQRLGGAAIQKVVQQQRPLDLGQVADDGAAQADQKAGKHQRHQPQAAAKPFFR